MTRDTVLSGSRGPHVFLASGLPFALLDPRPEEVDFAAFVHHLARQNRYCGATPLPLTVAQHTCLVAALVPVEARPYALLHDFHEAVIGDLTTPLKHALRIHAGRRGGAAFDPVEEISRPIDAAVHAAAGLAWPPPDSVAEAVARADFTAFLTEVRDCAPPEMAAWARRTWPDAPRSPRQIRPWTWAAAEERLFALFDRTVIAHALACPLLRPDQDVEHMGDDT